MKWSVLLCDSYDTTIFVKSFDTKEEALAALSHFLEEEPDYARFYIVRKDEEKKPIETPW